MTVAEVITKLQEMPQEMEVLLTDMDTGSMATIFNVKVIKDLYYGDCVEIS